MANIFVSTRRLFFFLVDITGEEKENSLKLFWDFVRSLNDDQKRKLIRFVTASSRPPMFGFEASFLFLFPVSFLLFIIIFRNLVHVVLIGQTYVLNWENVSMSLVLIPAFSEYLLKNNVRIFSEHYPIFTS